MAESSVKSKRLVKNPETFRERAVKAGQTADKPKRRLLRRFFAKVFGPVFSPVRRFLVKLFQVQPFKTVAKLFRWVGLVLLPPYIRNSWKELKLVTWPNLNQSRRLTSAVLAFAIVF